MSSSLIAGNIAICLRCKELRENYPTEGVHNLFQISAGIETGITSFNAGLFEVRVMNVESKKVYPFSLFKRADRTCYSVSFKDANGKYLRPVSTGMKNEADALQAAFKMLRDGILQNQKSITIQDLSLKDMIHKIKTGTEAEIVLSELKRLGWVKTFVTNNTPQAEDFISFLKTFWDWEVSPYIKEKLRKSHGIHKMHCLKQWQAITRYWEPFFKGRYLGDIIAPDIDAFINHIEDM